MRVRKAWREGLDILLLAIATFAWAAAAQTMLGGLPDPGLWLRFVIPAGALAALWLLLRLRGQGLATIGLRRPERPGRTIAIGLLIALFFFAASLGVEALGVERDLGALRQDVARGTPYLLLAILYAFLGAGLYEEATFRGFLMQRVAAMLGSGRGAWLAGAIVQAALFGLVHAHQGALGIVYTGLVGLVLAGLFFWNGRNLWPLVIGHGAYDAGRFVYFFLAGTDAS